MMSHQDQEVSPKPYLTGYLGPSRAKHSRFDYHHNRCRVITLSKIFTLVVPRSTQPSIPAGEVNE